VQADRGTSEGKACVQAKTCVRCVQVGPEPDALLGGACLIRPEWGACVGECMHQSPGSSSHRAAWTKVSLGCVGDDVGVMV